MDVFDERILTVIKVAIAAREDKVLSAFNDFRADVMEELSRMQELLKMHDMKYDKVLSRFEVDKAEHHQVAVAEKRLKQAAVFKDNTKVISNGDIFDKSLIKVPPKLLPPPIPPPLPKSVNKPALRSAHSFNLEDSYAEEQITSVEEAKPALIEASYSATSVIKAEVSESSLSDWAMSPNKASDDSTNNSNERNFNKYLSIERSRMIDENNLNEGISNSCSSTPNVVMDRKEIPTAFVDRFDPKTQTPVMFEVSPFGESNLPLNSTKPPAVLSNLGKMVSLNSSKTKTLQENLQCDVCSKTFASKRSLKNHMLLHNSDKKFKCLICGKMLNRKSSIREHVKMHQKGKQFKCELCGKSFGKRTCLKRHIMIHTGEKPFQCPTCTKCFSRKGYLKIHSEICGKRPPSLDPPLELNWAEISTETLNDEFSLTVKTNNIAKNSSTSFEMHGQPLTEQQSP